MARPKINPEELQRLLAEGRTQADAARHFGVSEAAISQRLKKLTGLTTRVVALEKAGDVVDQRLTATGRLQHAQRVILDRRPEAHRELQWAKQQTEQPGADRTVLVDVLVKLAAEVRAQLRLEHDISRTLIDLRVVREFQQGVIQVISEESPEVGRRIVARLKERRALRASGTLPALDGQGGF